MIKILEGLAWLDDLAWLDYLEAWMRRLIKERLRWGAWAKINDGAKQENGEYKE